MTSVLHDSPNCWSGIPCGNLKPFLETVKVELCIIGTLIFDLLYRLKFDLKYFFFKENHNYFKASQWRLSLKGPGLQVWLTQCRESGGWRPSSADCVHTTWLYLTHSYLERQSQEMKRKQISWTRRLGYATLSRLRMLFFWRGSKRDKHT